MRWWKKKLVLSVVLVIFYFFLPAFSFPCDNFWGHVLYPLSHANIYHLLANILCFWMIRTRMHLVLSYLCAVICSFLPCFMSEPTMGFSGVLFCMVGISWGKVHRFKDMIWNNKWFLALSFMLPHVNAFIHLYCLFGGYLIGITRKSKV